MSRNKKYLMVYCIFTFCLLGVSFAPMSQAAPPAPQFLPGFPMLAGDQAMVMWMPIPTAKEYKVYRNGKVVNVTAGAQFFDPLGGAAGEYKYEISAVGTDGIEGPRSPEKVIRIVVLKTPKDLMVRRIEKSVSLRWESVEGAAIYNIYRAEKDAPAEYKLLTSVTGNFHGDSGVAMGKTYFYKVSAKDLSGKESSMSTVAMVRMEEVKAAEAEKQMVRRAKTAYVFKNGLDLVSGHKVDLRAVADVAITKDKVFISSTASKRVSVFNRETGGHLFDIGNKGIIPEKDQGWGFAVLSSMRISTDGKELFVSDYIEKKMYIFDTDGNRVGTFEPEQPAPPDKPTYVDKFDIDGEGNVWAVDSVNKKVRVHARNGKQLRTIGEKSGLNGPTFCRIDVKRDRFYVVDYRQDNKTGYAVFDLKGKFIKFFGEKGVTYGKFWSPSGFDVMENGNLVASDGILSVINVIDPVAGKVIYNLIDEDGKKVVQINSARGVRVDGERIYVASGMIDEVEVLEMVGSPYEKSGN
jgi:hypothetical protein